jgi:hypothetical protein
MPRITKRKAEHRSGNVAQIGLLTRKTDASVASQIDAFRQGLQDLVADIEPRGRHVRVVPQKADISRTA